MRFVRGTGDGCLDGGEILIFEEEDLCDVFVLRLGGYKTSLGGGGGGRLDGGVIPVLEREDCCNLLGESGCSECLMVDVTGMSGRLHGGVIPLLDIGDCCSLFIGPPKGLSTVICACTGGNTL